MPTRDDLNTARRDAYAFIQRRPGPASPLDLFSVNGYVGGIEEPVASPEPRFRKSLTQRGQFDRVGEVLSPPDAFTVSLTEKVPRETASYLERLKKSGERFAVHVIISRGGDPQDTNSWESKEVFEGVGVTGFSRDDVEADEDEYWTITSETQYASRERLFHLYFGAEATTEITNEVIDVAVYPPTDNDDYDIKEIYKLTKVVGAVAPKLIYSLDGGRDWSSVSLTTVGTDEPDALAVVGDYVIIVSSAAGAYYYARKNALATWTKVSAGFVPANGPTCLYAPAVGSIFMGGLGGYIYKLGIPGQPVQVLEAGSATVQNLNAIHGVGSTLLAVGDANAAVLSNNGGRSWAALTGPKPATALNCCWVIDKDTLWVGGDQLYYSRHAGVDWTPVATGIPGLTAITALVFSAESTAIGYVAGTGGANGYIARTTTFGNDFETESLHTVPAADRWNALAVGGPNFLVAAGLADDGTDGIAALGTDPR
ncbi:MAG: hypothetical protein OZ924_10700 [Burkholderiaceae bacterium]|nr:hypothetical protein [Burkholderiaceae bacterium]